ncbi:hypothetical protein BC826DRAFT_1113879 [Russula brevipes]|nr:hypothetical protein BC826DRAFT_1113879 [Russula brevipes]
MPSTPPPPSPPLPAAAASPLTSPQHYQHAIHHHERTGCTMDSPEQHRIPALLYFHLFLLLLLALPHIMVLDPQDAPLLLPFLLKFFPLLSWLQHMLYLPLFPLSSSNYRNRHTFTIPAPAPASDVPSAIAGPSTVAPAVSVLRPLLPPPAHLAALHDALPPLHPPVILRPLIPPPQPPFLAIPIARRPFNHA